MCYCTPGIRTPWCGKALCVPTGILSKKKFTFDNDELVRHVKTGSYYKIVEVNAKKEDDGSHVVVYRGQADGQIWVRPYSEFEQKFIKA